MRIINFNQKPPKFLIVLDENNFTKNLQIPEMFFPFFLGGGGSVLFWWQAGLQFIQMDFLSVGLCDGWKQRDFCCSKDGQR